jgi:hypothetical protein
MGSIHVCCAGGEDGVQIDEDEYDTTDASDTLGIRKQGAPPPLLSMSILLHIVPSSGFIRTIMCCSPRSDSHGGF